MVKSIDCTKLLAANAALGSFAKGTTISRRKNGWYVSWTNSGGDFTRRWQTHRGSDWYPVWHRYWGHGGTACQALAQLVRWLRDQPVLPLSSWHHWASDAVKLLEPEAVHRLADAGWPTVVPCVLCGRQLGAGIGLDWWNLKNVSGPCCFHTEGCRQDPNHPQPWEAHVVFTWETGHRHAVKLLGNLMGLKHDGRRPDSYVIKLGDGLPKMHPAQIRNLDKWLQQVPQALGRVQHGRA